MQTFFEQFAPYLVAVYTALVLTLVVFLCIREARLQSRKKITFDNFSQTIQLFNLKINVKNVALTICAAALGVVLIYFLRQYNVTKIYVLPTAAELTVCAVLLAREFTVKLTNFNMEPFVRYYNDIQKTDGKKDAQLKDLQKKETVCNAETETRVKLINKVNDCFKRAAVDTDIVQQAFAPYRQLIRDNVQKMEESTAGAVRRFNDALQTYLTTQMIDVAVAEIIDVPEDSVFNAEFQKACDTINRAVFLYSNKGIETGTVANCASLIQLLEINASLHNDTGKLIPHVITSVPGYTDSDVGADYLYKNKLLQAEHFDTLIVPADASCYFDAHFNTYFTEQQRLKIVTEIIDRNAKNSTFSLLANSNDESIDLMERAMQASGRDNEVKQIFISYVSLFSAAGGYSNEANMYENMAMSLQDFYLQKYRYVIQTENNKHRVDDVIAAADFVAKRQFIVSCYKEVSDGIKKVSSSLVQLFIILQELNNPWIDSAKASQLYREYKSTLNADGIYLLTLLLSAVILKFGAANHKRNVFDVLKATPFLRENKQAVVADGDAQTTYKNIMIIFRGSMRSSFLQVLNRVESKRLVYEEFAG